MKKLLLGDREWAEARGSVPFGIAVATFAILMLELALIRWTASQVRAFAYFSNLVLIGAFLGMGLGLALGRRRPGLIHLCLPMLLVVSLPVAFSERLGLMHLAFPDQAVFLWGADGSANGVAAYLINVGIFLGLFCLIVGVFITAGAAVGCLFHRKPPLEAYAADLGGSLFGVLFFTAITFMAAGPHWWLAVGGGAILWLSRSVISALSLACVVALATLSVQGAFFSPYNRIDVTVDGANISLDVNRDFHQVMLNLSDDRLNDPGLSEVDRHNVEYARAMYDLPFQLAPRRERALVVGAGTGNDAQAALRNGFQSVVSVDIDGLILALGRELHPEQPYSDARVTLVENDARAFLGSYSGPPFDLVSYGLLDSHAMFSSMSSLRLDNYVYTHEGLAAAWRHVGEGGLLSVNFSVFAGSWIVERLAATIVEATGQEPLILNHGVSYGATFLVWKGTGPSAAAMAGQFPVIELPSNLDGVRVASDDWPFLYVRPDVVPWTYLLVLAVVMGLALVATPLAFGRDVLGSRFDPVLFLMGAAFLLIETRGVTSLSLLFGSTWLVNSSVFAGILIMVLLANGAVIRWHPQRLEPWFVLLFVSTGLLAVLQPSQLSQLPMAARGIVGGLIHAIPIGFAGVIVSVLLSRSPSPAAALGSNLLGSVVGGCVEYSSMLVGLRALALLALAIYLAALLLVLRRSRNAPA